MVAGLTLFTVVVAIVLGLLLSSLDDLSAANRGVVRTERAVSLAFAAETAIIDMETGLRGYLISRENDVLEPWRTGRTLTAERLGQLRTTDQSPAQHALVRQLTAQAHAFVVGFGVPLLAAARAGMTEADEAAALHRGKQLVDRMRAGFNRYVAVETARAAHLAQNARDQSDRARFARIAGAVVLFLLIVAFGFVVARRITSPLRRIAQGANELAGGDLRTRVPESGAGEVGEVGRAFNAMATSLQVSDRQLRRLGEEHLALVEGVFAQTPVGLAFMDVEMRFVRVNAELGRIDGLAPYEHFDRPVREVLPREIGANVERQVRAVVDGGGVVTVSHVVSPRETGDEARTFDVTTYPVRALGDELLGVGAVVVETTRAHHQAVEREQLLADVQQAATRTGELQAATAALAAAVTPQDVLDVGIAHAIGAVRASAGLIAILEPDRATLRIAGSHGYPAETVDHFRTLDRGVRIPLTEAALRGRASYISSRRELLTQFPDMAPTGTPFSAWATLPLVGHGRTLGAIIVAFDRERSFSAEDRSALAAIADQCAIALDRALVFAREREISTTLQHSLLPPSLPQPAGMTLSARYRATGEGHEVGGDFYDAIAFGEGSCLLAIGDVCGKGPAAAAVTGMARHTLRADVIYNQDPSGLLARLNQVLLRDSPDRFCTAAIARVDLDGEGAHLTWALAGHHPAILVPAEGAPRTLDGRGGPVLGIIDGATAPDHRTDLGRGDVVLLHTDGLLDAHAPARQLEQEDVLAVLADGPRDPDALLDRLLAFAAEGTGEPRDDIALVAIRVG
jgi:serine phosphatase RsbU (regulator of sigma subunit)/CHASE3 domain sensor protein